MRNLRCGLVAAALLACCVSGSALAQDLIVGETGDPSILTGLPTPVIAEVFVGPLLGQFPNARVSGPAVPFASGDVPFVSDQGVDFTLEVVPDPDGALVRFDVGGEVMEAFSSFPAADDIFDINALFVVANSGAPGLIARASNMRLEVPTGGAGGIGTIAEANGGSRPFSIVSLACVSYAQGFVLTGQFTFVGTPNFPIEDYPASVQVRLAETSEDCTVDSDLDGVANDFPDNCPLIANADQSDMDFDGLGDVCDECPKEAEPSEDLDGDGVGFLCDNCPQGCQPIQEGASCSNASQANEDEDSFGNACDNCPLIFNEPVCCIADDPLNPFKCVPAIPEMLCTSDADCSGEEVCRQADTDGDREGNACEFPGVAANAEEDPPPVAGSFGFGPVTSNGNSVSYGLTVKCGPGQDLTTANIPFRVPPAVTGVVFETCDQAPDPSNPIPQDADEAIRGCTPFPVDIDVDHTRSYTRGPDIIEPDLGEEGDRVFIVTVAGSLPRGAGEEPALCLKEDGQSTEALERNRPLGSVTFTGLLANEPDQPSIVTDKLNFFEQESLPIDGGLGLGRCVAPTTPEPDPTRICTLVSSGPDPVDTNLTTTTFNTGSGVKIEVRPAFDAAFGERVERFQVSLLADEGVKLLAIGMRGFVGMQGPRDDGMGGTITDATFGGCTLDQMLLLQGYDVYGCETVAQNNNDLGPTVAGGTATSPPPTYVLYPATPNAPVPPAIAADTVYVVFQGTRTDGSINVAGERTLLGIFEYAEGFPDTMDLPQPVVVTEGVTELPDPALAGLANIAQPVTFVDDDTSPTVDSVGGAGTGVNSDDDTLPDELDNCPNRTNQIQADDGTFLLAVSDGTGNICQCGNGDQNNDGVIDGDDRDDCLDFLVTSDTGSDAAQRCAVLEEDSTFDVSDLATLDLAITLEGVCRSPDGLPPANPLPCQTDQFCQLNASEIPNVACLDKVSIQQGCPQAGEPL